VNGWGVGGPANMQRRLVEVDKLIRSERCYDRLLRALLVVLKNK